jgi:hypothetical protein
MKTRSGLGIAGFIALFGLSAIAADEPATKEPEKERTRDDRLCDVYKQQAAEFEMRENGNESNLTLEEKPIFQWVNPARVGQRTVHHGLVFAWTRDGRAEAIGTVFSVTGSPPSANLYHELHSLSTGGMKARWRGQSQWDTKEPGIELKAVPDAPEPGGSEAQRGSQMREIARRFTGYSINYDEKRWELNLLPKPLYRMPKSAGDVIDQGVFALVSTAGTDPEILVDIEARNVDGQPQWQYAVCRFTDLKSFVSLDDQVVWSFENGSHGAYTEADASRRYHFSSSTNESVP